MCSITGIPLAEKKEYFWDGQADASDQHESKADRNECLPHKLVVHPVIARPFTHGERPHRKVIPVKYHNGGKRQQQSKMTDESDNVPGQLAKVLTQEIDSRMPVADKRPGHCQHQHDAERMPLQITNAGECKL